MSHLFESLLAIEKHQKPPGATAEQIRLFAERLGHALPALLVEILGNANGGDWAFGRFVCDPLIHAEIADWSADEVWEDLRQYGSLEDHPLVLERKIVPLCTDYGAGTYCLDYRKKKNPAVVFAEFESDGAVEAIAADFSRFIATTIAEVEAEAKVKATPIEIVIPSSPRFGVPIDVPFLAARQVVFELVDPEILAKISETGTFPDPEMAAHYRRRRRALAFTMYDLREGYPGYGIVQEKSGLTPADASVRTARGVALTSPGSGIRYLWAVQLGKPPDDRKYPVWSMSTHEDRPDGAVLVITMRMKPA